MGTTLTAAMVDGAHVAVAHVGDSRAYLLHAGRLERLTEDHSMVADLIRQGSLTEEDARFHPQRSVITRALGSDPNMAADVFEVEGAPGDRLLLCSDGLSGMLDDEHIAEILQAQSQPEQAVQALVDAANRAGGYDNITAVVVDLTATAAGDYTPRHGSAASGRRVAARLLWIVAAAALLAATAWGAWTYARSQAYLVEENGVVAVFRGVPGSFAGLSLHWRVETTDIHVEALRPPLPERLRAGIAVPGVEAALRTVGEYRSSLATATPAAIPTATVTPGP
jgi:protein phosphatase